MFDHCPNLQKLEIHNDIQNNSFYYLEHLILRGCAMTNALSDYAVKKCKMLYRLCISLRELNLNI
jgi:hypothetical protein